MMQILGNTINGTGSSKQTVIENFASDPSSRGWSVVAGGGNSVAYSGSGATVTLGTTNSATLTLAGKLTECVEILITNGTQNFTGSGSADKIDITLDGINIFSHQLTLSPATTGFTAVVSAIVDVGGLWDCQNCWTQTNTTLSGGNASSQTTVATGANPVLVITCTQGSAAGSFVIAQVVVR